MGGPIQRAEVLAGPEQGIEKYRAVTDATGRYILIGIAPGRYRLWARRPGFLPSRPSASFVLASGETRKDANLALDPPAAITGHVYDEDGEPLNIPVQLWRETWRRGRRRLVEADSATAGDDGEYRFYGLVGGHYFVSTAQIPIRVAGMVSREAYAQMFYPGADVQSTAVPLNIASGSEARYIDFHLQRTSTVTIGLKVSGTSSPDQNVALTLQGYGRMANLRVNSNAGEFRIDGVTPGSYTLTASSEYEDRLYYARMNIEVGTRDLEDLRIELSPALEARAMLRFEGKAPPDGAPLPVTLWPADPDLPRYTARPDDDGTYTWKNLTPGTWTVAVDSLPEGAYLKSPREIEVRPGKNGPFEIVVSPRGARVEGSAGEGTTVVLITENSPRIEATATAGPNGKFALSGIPPGKYRLVALEDVDVASLQSPDVLRSFSAKGVAVELAPAQRIVQDLVVSH